MNNVFESSSPPIHKPNSATSAHNSHVAMNSANTTRVRVKRSFTATETIFRHTENTTLLSKRIKYGVDSSRSHPTVSIVWLQATTRLPANKRGRGGQQKTE